MCLSVFQAGILLAESTIFAGIAGWFIGRAIARKEK